MIKKILSLFKKKEKYDYPYEFGIIKFNDNSKKHGVFDDMTKVIEHHRGDVIREYMYSEEKIMVMQEDGIPVWDETTDEFKVLILKKINPALIQYEQEVE